MIFVNGRDENCDEKFNWCGDKNASSSTVGSEFPWGESEPNDWGGNENCIALLTNGESGTLVDLLCYAKAHFICQARCNLEHIEINLNFFFFNIRAMKFPMLKSIYAHSQFIDQYYLLMAFYISAVSLFPSNFRLLNLKTNFTVRRRTSAK
jgi:Lectin C-type domain